MSSAVVYNGINALDFKALRVNVVRIPEVINRMREAQRIWDEEGLTGVDFLNFIASDDDRFLANIKMKSLAAAIVQIGLYDRYVKRFGNPRYLIGDCNGDSPLLVCVGKLSFKQLVLGSQSALSQTNQGAAFVNQLSGIQLSQLAVYDIEANEVLGPVRLEIEEQDIDSVIRFMVDEMETKSFINIGPGSELQRLRSKYALEELEFSEAIDLDPMLSWFWRPNYEAHLSLAQ